MPSDGRTPSPDSELASLIRSRGLTYPITTKVEFVRLMTGALSPVVFRSRRYDPGFGASLVPEFFFPATPEQDLLTKIGGTSACGWRTFTGGQLARAMAGSQSGSGGAPAAA